MKVLFGVLADAANQTADGKLNVLGVFSSISAVGFPTIRPVAYVVVRLEISAAEIGRPYQMALVQIDADGNQIARHEVGFTPNRREGAGGALADVADLIIQTQLFAPKPGAYQISIMFGDDEKGTIPFSALKI